MTGIFRENVLKRPILWIKVEIKPVLRLENERENASFLSKFVNKDEIKLS